MSNYKTARHLLRAAFALYKLDRTAGNKARHLIAKATGYDGTTVIRRVGVSK